MLDEVLKSKDELLMVLRSHQLVDGLLSDLIEEQLIEKHHLELRRIPFAVRVELAQAMGLLNVGDRGALIQFNTLRNRFAHEAATTITHKDSQDLYNGIGDRLRFAAGDVGRALETPRTCVETVAACLVLSLDITLERVREEKLWGTAVMQEARAVVSRLPKVESSPVHDRIRARYEALKAERCGDE